MNTLRIIKSGMIVWSLIFLSFMCMGLIPVLKANEDLQNIIILLVLSPIVWIGAKYFYRTGGSAHGIKLGVGIISVSLTLDALITVPFVIIPAGGSYLSFFINPGLVVMGLVIIGISYYYWRIKSATFVSS